MTLTLQGLKGKIISPRSGTSPLRGAAVAVLGRGLLPFFNSVSKFAFRSALDQPWRSKGRVIETCGCKKPRGVTFEHLRLKKSLRNLWSFRHLVNRPVLWTPLTGARARHPGGSIRNTWHCCWRCCWHADFGPPSREKSLTSPAPMPP